MEKLPQSGYLCHPWQACTLRRMTITEGKAHGTQLIEGTTAGSLSLDILPDAGLDIGQVRYRGTNVSFICKNGYDSPAVISPHEDEFLRTFPGGLLYTCGLRSTGNAHRDGNEWHPMHGRYHSLQAEQVAAYMEKDTVIIRGVVRETALFGYCLQLTRVIRIPVFGSEVAVEDTLVNLTHAPEEYAQLYHCNFRWSLVGEHAELVLPQKRRNISAPPCLIAYTYLSFSNIKRTVNTTVLSINTLQDARFYKKNHQKNNCKARHKAYCYNYSGSFV